MDADRPSRARTASAEASTRSRLRAASARCGRASPFTVLRIHVDNRNMRSVKYSTGTPVPTLAGTARPFMEDASMEYVPLGRSGLKISRVCLGAMNFGAPAGTPGCEEDEARSIIGAYLDAGGNIIDTADGYSGGQSEEIVGRAVRGRRDAVVLATKAFLPRGPGPNDRGLSRVHLTRALEASLRRLGTDYIDLYQCHQWDPATPIEETMDALDAFVRA